jgi:CheY-like chemotaxis protein
MRGRVLVVDDDALIRQAAERSLTRAGFEVATAATTWQARFLSATGLFDVAILDYFLEPGERGCDLIPELRARSPAIRIAVVSFVPPKSPQLRTSFGEPVGSYSDFEYSMMRTQYSGKSFFWDRDIPYNGPPPF